MAFKKLDGLTEAGNVRTLFTAKVINVSQDALRLEIIAYYEGRTLLTRKELRDAHGALRGKKAAPYWASKNVACKTKAHGVYDLSKLKLSASAAKASEETAKEIDAPAAKKSSKKKAKKEASPKLEESVSKKRTKKETKQIEAAASDDAKQEMSIGGDFANNEAL